MREIAKQLIEEHQRHWKAIHKIENTGIELPESLKLDLLDFALDLLGVPKDTTTTAKKDTADYYCRDHFWYEWDYDYEADDFIDYAIEQTKLYREETANGTLQS